jgi:hypothetical protein
LEDFQDLLKNYKNIKNSTFRFLNTRNQEESDILLIFEFFVNICAIIRPVLKKMTAGLPGSVRKLQKY